MIEISPFRIKGEIGFEGAAHLFRSVCSHCARLVFTLMLGAYYESHQCAIVN